ncbi:hypothetical protein [Chitinophaga niabensis]|uniref:Uncharacterized protein n=1 Tax=Chitinophaga niabensis TaxID=536979 RepID=A0A1N6K9L7_9BACT|nr:hypothetical protein [Chitinophaga niabensis]SIO53016.1 hypothetical protein SAMN04488055_5337 [Chitinophaga niabensis]
MFPVTIVIIALHIIIAIRLVFFNRQEVKNTETEPTLLQIFLAGISITLLSLGKGWVSILIAAIVWAILKFYKRKKISSSE